MAAGSNAMEKVFDLAGERRGKVVHRAALLAELLRPIDRQKMHTNKKLARIEELDTDRLKLYFENGETFEAHIVIGADGIHGHVRQHILGDRYPATFAGFCDARSLIPMQKAKELLGEEYFEVDRQYGWIGDGGFFMHDI